MLTIRARGATACGPIRSDNEDAFRIDEDLGFYVVCDGMGGHSAGDIASRTAIDAVARTLRDQRTLLEGARQGVVSPHTVAELVEEAIQAACAEIYCLAEKVSAPRGMGTTVTMLVALSGSFVMGHVGDSRLYLRRRDMLHQLSRDHTVVAHMVADGLITPEEAAAHPESHALTRAVGMTEWVEVDTLIFDVVPGDTLLLCSDGVSAAFSPDHLMPNILTRETATPEAIIEEAHGRDGSDNATAVCLWVAESDGLPEHHQRHDEVLLTISTLKQMFVLSDLSYEELLKVTERFEVVDVAKDYRVITQGEYSDGLYIILDGDFSVTRDGEHLALLKTGDHFGEMALISQRPRTASVKALRGSRVLRIHRADFAQLVASNPTIGVKMLWALSNELCRRLEEAM